MYPRARRPTVPFDPPGSTPLAKEDRTMGKKILAAVILGLCAGVYTIGFKYLGDEHQGLMVFGSLMVAASAGRRSVRKGV